jgi:hypothetical protein
MVFCLWQITTFGSRTIHPWNPNGVAAQPPAVFASAEIWLTPAMIQSRA